MDGVLPPADHRGQLIHMAQHDGLGHVGGRVTDVLRVGKPQQGFFISAL